MMIISAVGACPNLMKITPFIKAIKDYNKLDSSRQISSILVHNGPKPDWVVVVGVLVGNDIERIRNEYFQTLSLNRKPSRPELWDGKTANRIVKLIADIGHKPDFSILKAFSYENLD